MKTYTKLLAGSVLLALGTSASATNIDLFSQAQGPYTDGTIGGGFVGGSVADGIGGTMLGGERDLYVNRIGGTNLTGEATVNVAGGVFDFSTDTRTTAAAQIQWDGIDGSQAINATGLGGVDLLADGAVGFSVDTIFADADFEFVITAYTDAAHWTAISLQSHEVNAPTLSFIPFAAFMNPALCGAFPPDPNVNSIMCAAGNQVADLSNLGALVVDIDPSGKFVSLDLSLDSITTVPEPSTIGLLGLGLLGAGFAGSRRRKSKS